MGLLSGSAGKFYRILFQGRMHYGKPGNAFTFPCRLLTIVFFLIPTLWAKRANQFIGCIDFYICAENFYSFSDCYYSDLPADKTGLTGMLVFSLQLFWFASLLSKARLEKEKDKLIAINVSVTDYVTYQRLSSSIDPVLILRLQKHIPLQLHQSSLPGKHRPIGIYTGKFTFEISENK